MEDLNSWKISAEISVECTAVCRFRKMFCVFWLFGSSCDFFIHSFFHSNSIAVSCLLALSLALCVFVSSQKMVYLFNHRDLLVCFWLFYFPLQRWTFWKTKWKMEQNENNNHQTPSKSNNYLEKKLSNQNELKTQHAHKVGNVWLMCEKEKKLYSHTKCWRVNWA